MFSLVHALLFAPLPYANADRLAMVWEHNVPRDRPRNVISAANYLAWSERSTSFEETAIFGTTTANLTGLGEPEELRGLAVEATLLRMVGAQPMLGRVFVDGEDQPGTSQTVILTEGLWRRRLGSDPNILGQRVMLSDEPATVVGVMPSHFELFGQRVDFFRPLVLQPAHRELRGRGFLSVGLLKPGLTRDQAQQELAAVFEGLVREHPDFNSGWTINIVPLRAQLTGDVRPALLVLFGAVAAVLLIACVNIVNLLLARATTREHELAVRAALGAGTGRLMRQLFTETAILVTLGGGAGLLLAWWLQRLLVETALAAAPVPLMNQVGMNVVVIAFAAGATLATAVACGLGPAFTVRRRSLVGPLHDGSRGSSSGRHSRVRAALVVAEVAVAVLLLSGAGLLARSFTSLQAVDPGFDASGVLTMRVTLAAQSEADLPRVLGLQQTALERLQQVPGVEAAAGTVFLPMAGAGSATSFWLEDRPEPGPADRPVADIRPITAGYFRAMRIPQLTGRDFEPADTQDRPLVGIVNEAFVREFYAGRNPVGQRLTYSWNRPTTVEIVGVVGDVALTALDGQPRSTLYLPFQQRPLPMMHYVVRTAGAPASIATAAVASVQALDPNQPIAQVRTLEEVLAASLTTPRLTSSALGAFAATALLLAVVGVYGVIAYGVAQRRREFGVRLALGAQPRDVLGLVLRQGGLMVGAGVGIGIALSVVATRGLRSLLYGVEPGDPVTLAAVATAILVVAGVACYVPALRSTRVDPTEALRAE